MLEHKLKTVITADHRLTLEIPAEVPVGPAEVTLLVTPLESAQEPDSDKCLRSSEACQQEADMATDQEMSPDTVLDRLRQLVAEGQLTAVRQLADEAAQRFPDHAEIQLARRVFSEAKATTNPFVQPTTAAEIEWLNDPPEETRGKWVALVGNELVGLADTLTDLVRQVEEKDLQQLPLVQQIAA